MVGLFEKLRLRSKKDALKEPFDPNKDYDPRTMERRNLLPE